MLSLSQIYLSKIKDVSVKAGAKINMQRDMLTIAKEKRHGRRNTAQKCMEMSGSKATEHPEGRRNVKPEDRSTGKHNSTFQNYTAKPGDGSELTLLRHH